MVGFGDLVLSEDRSAARKMERACVALRYRPAAYAERERVKAEGWAALTSALSADEWTKARILILRAQFDRSLEAAILGGYWKRHPDLFVYIAMRAPWEDQAGVALGDVERRGRAAMQADFGPKRAGIACGSSYWVSRGHTASDP